MNNYKVPTNLDLDALRAFVKGIELGNFHLVAQQLCRSPAAISAQLKKLEQQAQCQLLRKNGRLLELTPNGELLFSTAKEILNMNDQVLIQLRQNQQDGYIRFGLQEDFGEGLLQNMIAQFMQLHPNVQFQVQVDRNVKLIEKVKRQELDLAIVWKQPFNELEFKEAQTHPVEWLYCSHPHLLKILKNKQSIPLVVLQQPCLLRQLAIEKLDEYGLPWHIAYECNSVYALWAAIRAGMGISLRSSFNIPQDIHTIENMSLPILPHLSFGLLFNPIANNQTTAHFQDYIYQNILTLN